MPRIEQRYLDCNIYLYRSEDSALAGENAGGSGFLVGVYPWPLVDRTQKNRYGMPKFVMTFPPHIYAVTNKHVARQGFPIIRLNTIEGDTDILPLEHGDWIPHPDGDDLAVAPLDLLPTMHHYHPISTRSFIRRDDFTRYIGAGDDTFMVGRFTTHGGKQRNTPSLRFGSIAMLPFEKIKLDEKLNHHMQEAFLVETRSMSGYSGSPVFVYHPEIGMRVSHDGAAEESGISDLVGTPMLLGIDCGHVPRRETVKDRDGKLHPNGWQVTSNTGMAIVIPAWRLQDLLDNPELAMKRKQRDEQYQKEKENEDAAVLDVEDSATLTRESYEDVLKRASRKISEPESEKEE